MDFSALHLRQQHRSDCGSAVLYAERQPGKLVALGIDQVKGRPVDR
jgi:hypothetical protein